MSKTTKNERSAQKAPKTPVRAVSELKLGYKVSNCAKHYLEALVNPWETPSGACVPADLFPLPSQKTKAHVRGTFQLGTSGIGYITAYIPVSNNANCISHTTSSSVGTSASPCSSFTNMQLVQCPMLPEDASVYALNRTKTRAVAAGLRVKYIGKLADQNGVCTGFEAYDIDSSATGTIDHYSFNLMNSSPYTSINRVAQGNDWDCSVCYSGPTGPRDLEFGNNSLDARHDDAVGVDYFLLIMCSGQPGDLYEYDFTFHIESIGQSRTARTISHSDPTGFAQAVQSTKSNSLSSPLEPSKSRSVWQSFKEGLTNSLPYLFEAGKGAVQLLMGDEMGGALTMGRASYKMLEQNFKNSPIRDYSERLPALPPPSVSHVESRVEPLPSRFR